MDEFEQSVRKIIREFKTRYFEDPDRYSIPLRKNGEVVGRLRPVPTQLKGEASRDAELQTEWRNLYPDSFLVDPFVATVERTKSWLEKAYNNEDSFIIFMVVTPDGVPVGHIGLSDFIFDKRMVEYGRLMRGERSQFETEKRVNLLELGATYMLNWAFEVLKVDKIYGRAFASNWLALRMNRNCGFEIVEKYPHLKQGKTFDLVRLELKYPDFKAAQPFFA